MRVAYPAGFPASWPLVSAKALFALQRRAPQESDGVVTAFRDGQVTLRTNRRTEGFTNAVAEFGYQGVRAGDLVVHSMDAFAGAIGVSDSDGKASPVVHAYRAVGRDEPRFYAYMLRDLALHGFIASLAKGIRERSTAFDASTFRSLVLPRPPVEEQRRIADFLDSETSKIDALIEMKTALSAALSRRFDAAVAEYTRRGLDPRVPMKCSGLPWIGDVPQHWRIAPTRSFLRRKRDLLGARSSSYTLLSLTKNGVIVRDTSENFGKFPASFDTYQSVAPDDLVFCLFDVPETPRTVGQAKDVGMVTGAYDVFTVSTDASAEYVGFLFTGIDNEKSLSLFYSGLRNVIRRETFLAIRCPQPPREEQRQIALRLRRLGTSADKARLALRQQVDLLRERRQALISLAVTGHLPNFA